MARPAYMRADTTQDVGKWAAETFGRAKVGDRRRLSRLVSIGKAAASAPAGTVPAVFGRSADREGAFRLLENSQVRAAAVAEAVFDATADQCARAGKRVYVAVDGSSLTLTDRARRRDLGRVGNSKVKCRGLEVMNSVALESDGTMAGVLDQIWWARTREGRRHRNRKCFSQNVQKTETRFWLEALNHAADRLRRRAPRVRPWFQLDRGADCWPVFELALDRKLLITIRAYHNRRLVLPDGRKGYLHQELARQPVLGHYEVELEATHNREARTARIAVRACRVTVSARVKTKRRKEFVLNAVLAEEVGHGPNRLRWLLLTTHKVDTFEQACAVIHGYKLRWRVEEFHRAWKRGGCNVEDSQLQSREAIVKWATILAAVAARSVRLADLARSPPGAPATDEFTEYEIEAAYILTKRKRDRRKTVLLHEVIDLVADLGGFCHKYSGGKPGPTVLKRGLLQVEVFARGLKNMAEM